ncbi:hypothetical protein GPECTOR_5000g1293 [Gonium pectorale]|uniref:Uncharacterized protein n=1 Tax=Gonium pectorale TaxID=33097 RepID=A0A150H4W3_GONPE|nr:hypothetical protein GPECTOR_5000g1290 [Gonium pectorale]KXZ57064.1 hypothetical protein GPECTOR_5000g1291 [Gonium pectorale]KXZ57065.1 hypothetical protein GPECTOR_5000g1292 [Gonium pectorale]KXZ57066.1 hypothetical protein GPECTOR_5000g1293 [Gonium pectorale]|eukprot:KXZ57063.1 hypothetical protein GPECTOR_5000g1290 [Gonium pectorale]
MVLDASPTPHSSHETWYSAHKDTLMSEAAAKYGVAVPGANVAEGAEVLSGEQLLESYLALLEKHFQSSL